MSVITLNNSTLINALVRKGYTRTSSDVEDQTAFSYIMSNRTCVHYANVYEDGSFHLYGQFLAGGDAYNSGQLHGCSEEEFMTFLSVWLDNFN